MSPKEEQRKIQQVSSCNTLQVPHQEEYSIVSDDSRIHININENLDKNKLPRPKSSANLFLQRIFGLDTPINEHSSKKEAVIKTVLESTPKRSPRILITRAFSEESEKSYSTPNTPAKDMTKKYSSSATTLLERKWRQLRYKDADDSDSEQSQRDKFMNQITAASSSTTTTTKPLLDNNSMTSNRSSDSSDASELSTGRLYLTLDKEIDINQSTEDQLLLSWTPNHKKYDENNLRKPRTNLTINDANLLETQSQEIIL